MIDPRAIIDPSARIGNNVSIGPWTLVGADVEMVRRGIGSDPRIGWHFIYPGAGYGGSCFPKDVQALVRTATEHNHVPEVLNAVESVNERQKKHVFNLISRHYDGKVEGKTIALWGLAFKPRTDDMREAASLPLIGPLEFTVIARGDGLLMRSSFFYTTREGAEAYLYKPSVVIGGVFAGFALRFR